MSICLKYLCVVFSTKKMLHFGFLNAAMLKSNLLALPVYVVLKTLHTFMHQLSIKDLVLSKNSVSEILNYKFSPYNFIFSNGTQI